MVTAEAVEKATEAGGIVETKFERNTVNGLAPFEKGAIPLQFTGFYTPEEITELKAANVEERMKVKISDWYRELAEKSEPLRNLVKARPEETFDLSGEADPSNQLNYSPVDGLLHKYEMVLLYAAKTCSAHCRYCYRLDLFSGKTGKGLAKVEEVAEYITQHNKKVEDQHGVDPQGRIFPIREALLSGGDPMVLSNKKLYEFMTALATAGVRTIRIGTKELAFFPHRFDDNFLAMLDKFHAGHPGVHVAFMVHFTHPDEILAKDEAGSYIAEGAFFKWMPEVQIPVKGLGSRPFISMENQTPIIDKVNDDPDALRILQKELRHKGIQNHYYFQCREIEGHKAFAVPVEEAWNIHNVSQRGLSGIEKSRFAMSTEWGKLEVVSVIEAPDLSGVPLPEEAKKVLQGLMGEGIVVFKVLRSPYSAENQGDLIIARRNPEALWISGYEDRIIYDGRKPKDSKYSGLIEMLAGMFEKRMVAA